MGAYIHNNKAWPQLQELRASLSNNKIIDSITSPAGQYREDAGDMHRTYDLLSLSETRRHSKGKTFSSGLRHELSTLLFLRPFTISAVSFLPMTDS